MEGNKAMESQWKSSNPNQSFSLRKGNDSPAHTAKPFTGASIVYVFYSENLFSELKNELIHNVFSDLPQKGAYSGGECPPWHTLVRFDPSAAVYCIT